MRRFTVGSAGWMFGIGLTVLFVSLWGRAVVVDPKGLGQALSPLSQSVVVTDRLTQWMESELANQGVAPDVADAAVARTFEESSADDVLGELVSSVVNAAAGVGPAGGAVDVARVLSPIAPDITHSLQSSGIDVSESQVASAIEGIDPLVIVETGARPALGQDSPAAARLGTAALLSVVVLIVAGATMVRASDDRNAAFRALLLRVALSGMSFALMLKIGSWILDPSGGRAPVSHALSQLADLKWTVPALIGAAAGAASAANWLVRRPLKQGEGSRSRSAKPIRQRG